jgi:hypothetical protein
MNLMRASWGIFLFFLFSFTNDTKQGSVEFFVGDGKYVKQVDLHFDSPFGYSQISSVANPNLVKIFGKYDPEKVKPDFSKRNSRGFKEARLAILDQDADGDLEGYSSIRNEWEVYLSGKKLFRLFLNYGTGNSNINLSDLCVSELSLHNIDASVIMDYLLETQNECVMKKMDLSTHKGYVKISNARLARAKDINIKVKYGTMSLDFSGEPLNETSIKAKVGAGTLRIDLPDPKFPVIIKVKGDDFSTTNLPAGFEEVSKGVYENPHYYVNAPNLMEIDVELGLGKLVIQ